MHLLVHSQTLLLMRIHLHLLAAMFGYMAKLIQISIFFEFRSYEINKTCLVFSVSLLVEGMKETHKSHY